MPVFIWTQIFLKRSRRRRGKKIVLVRVNMLQIVTHLFTFINGIELEVNGGESQFAGLKGSKSLGQSRQEGDWCEDQEAAPTPHLISECKHEFVLPMSAL